MGENSSIQWTTHTFNPWVGCQRVSPGCQHCYAEAYDKRVGGAKVTEVSAGVSMTYKTLRWGPKAPRVRTAADNWKKPLKWNKAAKAAGERHRVFCSSLADVFEDRPELVQWRFELLDLVRKTPHLDWLLLTKRPENVLRMLGSLDADAFAQSNVEDELFHWLEAWIGGSPPLNVWLGTTVEDQQRADERIPALLEVPAEVRFLSCEPLLERIDLTPWLDEDRNGFRWRTGDAVQWMIIGGESGHGARQFDLDWARDLVRQCRAADVAPFVKQLGARPVEVAQGIDHRKTWDSPIRDPAGGDMAEWPADLRVREFPRL